MFSMTSFGENVDEDLNNSRGPYMFKVLGQISHKTGLLCHDVVKGARFLQLYLFDTENEVNNRCRAFDNPRKRDLDEGIVMFLVSFLKDKNEYVHTCKTTKELVDEMNVAS